MGNVKTNLNAIGVCVAESTLDVVKKDTSLKTIKSTC
jgi:hypothetical protein